MFSFTLPKQYLTSTLPKELKEEIIQYCCPFSFVLFCTDIFKVPELMSLKSRYNLASWAIRNEYFSLLKWVRKTGLRTKDSALWDKNFSGVDTSIRRGNLDVLKWLRKKGCLFHPTDCALAANYGHIEILKWFHEIGVSFVKDYCIWACNSDPVIMEWLNKN